METSTRSKVPRSRKWSTATMAGAVASAFLASACCIGPLLLGLVGLSGAGLLIKLEPYRPYFTVVTLAALGAGFWFTYRRPKVAEGDACGCEHPKSNRAGKVVLWVVTLFVIGFWTFPYIAAKVLG
jgi:mercuric ion transport protein